MKRCLLVFILLLSTLMSLSALSYLPQDGKRGHRDDFAAVLPFEWNDRLEEWGLTITGNLDNLMKNSIAEYGGVSTYDYWKEKFGLSCGFGQHRHFFHWGYQTRPWSDDLLQFLPEQTKRDSARLEAFKNAVAHEQGRRNRNANAATEKALGFGSRGYQAGYANAFVAIIYDVHILGDYETKNIDGLAIVSVLVGELNRSIRTIDSKHSQSLSKKLTTIAQGSKPDKEKALEVLSCLRSELPVFILNANDGRVNMREHFDSLGFSIKPEYGVPVQKPSQTKQNSQQKPVSHYSPSSNSGSSEVMVTKSGKYHKIGASCLKTAVNPQKMNKNEAVKKGIPACKRCFPSNQ